MSSPLSCGTGSVHAISWFCPASLFVGIGKLHAWRCVHAPLCYHITGQLVLPRRVAYYDIHAMMTTPRPWYQIPVDSRIASQATYILWIRFSSRASLVTDPSGCAHCVPSNKFPVDSHLFSAPLAFVCPVGSPLIIFTSSLVRSMLHDVA